MNRRLLLATLILTGLAACMSVPAPVAVDARRVVVFFTADSAALDENAQQVIRQAAQSARSDPSAPVRVLGFAAPDTGTPVFNRALARARAQNVADGLVTAGVAHERVRIQPRGAVPFEQMPTESRRVEIAIGA